jgi:hypothetical protein
MTDMTNQPNPIVQYNPEVYFQNAITKARSRPDIKQVHLVVDSRERNRRLFPNPNNYEVNLVNGLNDVREIRMIASTFPFSRYMVHDNNNVMDVVIGSAQVKAIVETGEYESPSDMAEALQEALNDAVSGELFKVEFSARKDNFTISCTRSFSLMFQGGCFSHGFNSNPDFKYADKTIARIVGFGPESYASAVDENTSSVFRNVVSSPFRKNFEIDDTLIVSIDLMEINKSTSDTIENSFALVCRNGAYPENAKTVYYDEQIVKKFVPPLGKLTKFKVSIRDYDGYLYDFQNQEHRMEFLVDTNIRNRS